MADNLVYKATTFYTKNMKPSPGEGIGALWARMLADNTGAAYYFKNLFIDNVSLIDNEEADYDTAYDWSSRYVLILAMQDVTSMATDSWAYKSTNTYINTSGSGIGMVCIQALQLTSSFQDIKPRNDGSDRMQIKYKSGGGITIKNIFGGTAYHTLIILGLKLVS